MRVGKNKGVELEKDIICQTTHEENELEAREEEISKGSFRKVSRKPITVTVRVGWRWHLAAGNLEMGISAAIALGSRDLATGNFA